MPISVDSPDGIAGYGLEIQYDPSVLTPSATAQAGTAGGVSAPTYNPNYSSDTIFITWASTNALTSGGSLAVVSFKVNSNATVGATTLSWDTSGISVNDINGTDITNNFNFTNGAINVPTTPVQQTQPVTGSSGLVATPTVPTAKPTTPVAPVFVDVSTSYWGYDAISSLSSKGIVSGYPDGTFSPGTTVTRAEFATMLVKGLGLNTTKSTGQFTDVTADAWCYETVNAAASAGLVSGTGDHLFAPNAPITREQMAVMVTKALGTKAPAVNGTELSAFSDSSTVDSWAVSGMDEAVKAGIVSGMTADTLAPQANATRAQAAAMIYKVLTVLSK